MSEARVMTGAVADPINLKVIVWPLVSGDSLQSMNANILFFCLRVRRDAPLSPTWSDAVGVG